ncbi:MAG: flagellar hook-associated protein FlgL [Nitrospiria bacterium]
MRVSEKMLLDNVADRLQRQSASLLKLQDQVTGGKRINKPSDDPLGQADVIHFEKSIESTEQYLRNIDQLTSFVSASETVLQTVQDQLIRARALAIQAANATNTAADRTIIAREVRQIYDQLIAVGNTNHAGTYLFAGNQVNTQPFVNQGTFIGTAITPPLTISTGVNDVLNITIDGVTDNVTLAPIAGATGAQLAASVETAINANTTFQNAGISVSASFDTDHLVFTSNAVGGTSAVTPNSGTAFATLVGAGPGTARAAGTYLGDSTENAILIGENTRIVKNMPGDRLLKGAGGGVDVLSVVGALQSALESNDVTGIQTALGNLTGAQDQVNNERSLIGARLNRAEASESMLEDFKLTVSRLKSETEDIDLPATISKLLLQESMLEATRAVTARVVQRSLLDFLR